MRFVATSDWHLSSVRPLCRTDADWIAAQQQYLNAMLDENLPILVAGDIFDTPTVAPVVTNMVLGIVNNLYTIAGNHDLPYHSLDKVQQSSYGALLLVSNPGKLLNHVSGLHFGEERTPSPAEVLMLHTFAVKEECDRPPMRESVTARELLDRYPDFSVILVGDNHTPWVYTEGRRIVINCGCLIHRNATDAKHTCGYWVVDTEKMVADYRDLTYLGKDNLDMEYLDVTKEREANIQAYEALVNELHEGVENSYDFISALQQYVNENGDRMEEPVKEFLLDTLYHIKGEIK